MTISAGSRLGPYELLAPIGAGGMGEVWRARDTRLDRSVAIKLLPVEFASNEQLRLRFEREAKTISQLNDPHICTLYDVGHENGRDYLVMEYLEGETLADRIARGSLAFKDVIRYGVEVARALERAHAAGVIHRDLKPGNVMLTRSGAKLLDFGLAKSRPAVAFASPESATHQKPLTAEGTILGTLQYMAPEQLEGHEADARTDIFAFGTTLYEMATGRRAFEGKTRTSLIAAIVDRDPPPISSSQPLTPRAFERVVRVCLAKDPADRWQSAHDVRIELQWLAEQQTEAIVPRKRSRAAWSVAALLAVFAIAATALWVRAMLAARNQPAIRTSILPPPGTAFDFFLESGGPELSPDGRKIAFLAATPNADRTLWVRTLDSAAPHQLKGTDGASQPFWSPDSRSIAFWADGVLKRIDTNGGAPVTICPIEVVRGGTWNRDGTIVFGRIGGGLMKVPAAGGTPVEITALEYAQHDTTHRWPHFLPDGRHFLFLTGPHAIDAAAASGGDRICAGSIEAKMKKDLIRASSNVVYHDGWIIFVRDRMLTAQRFDARKLEVSGDPITLTEQQVEYDSATARAFFSLAPNGTLLYQTGEGLQETDLAFADRHGNSIRTVGEPQHYRQISLSPDGRSIAYSVVPRQNIWMIDLARGVKTRVTSAKAHEYAPVWSPDGTKLVFSSDRGDRSYDLYLKDIRSGAEEPLVVSTNDKTASSWSRDGRYILYTELQRGPTNNDIQYYSFVDRKSHPYVATQFNETGGKFSPDGKWVAYQSTETAPWQIYLSPFPPTGAKWQVSSGIGVQAHWRADGSELYFRTWNQLMAVPLKLSAVPEIGAPARLFEVHFGVSQSWDVAVDGQTFLLTQRRGDAPPPAPLTLVQHFDTELREAGEKRE